MKKIVALLTLVPSLAALGDIAPPIRRLQRIGYEVHPEIAVQSECEGAAINLTSCEQVSYSAGFVIALVGILLVWVLVNHFHVRTAWRKVRLILHRKWWGLIVIVLIGCVSALRMAVFIHELSEFEFVAYSFFPIVVLPCVALSCIVRAIISRVYRERMGWTYVIVSVLCYAAMLPLALCIIAANNRRLNDLDDLGWKYPTELTEKERIDFNSKMNSLPLRMRGLIEAEWKKDPFNGSDGHATAVVLEVLKSDAELLSACIGIPVELIVSHYFITEMWDHRRWYSFTHPRTVCWNSKLNSLPLRMRELIEAEWKKDPFNGSDDHAKAVVLEVLRSDAELRSACIDIPVELIVLHYFTTDYEWYNNEWNQYRRSSFTHPRTVRWADIEWKIEKNTREIVEKARREMGRSNKFDDTDAVLHNPSSPR